MIMFLISFFSLYSLLHFYVFMKARNALALGVRAGWLLVLFMLVMIASPLIIRQFEKYGLDPLARVMAYAGFTWLGFLFLLVCGLLVIDLYRLVLHVAGLLSPARSVAEGLRTAVSSRGYFLLVLSVSLLISVYGSFEACRVGIEKICINTSKIPAAASPLRIVQISDVHIGLIVRDNRVRKIIEQVKKTEPDLFLSTGDLVDGNTASSDRLAEMLREVHPRYGKFAITGNHEYYAGVEQAVAFTKKAGFTVLRGERANVGDFLTIVGIDDPAGPGMIKGDGDLEGKLLASPSAGRFTLLLKHRPDVKQASLGHFDLQLSGHLHKGQIFPFRFFVRLFYPMYAGLYALDRNSSLYVSGGSGTWGPPIRFLAPPKVTLIELVHRDG